MKKGQKKPSRSCLAAARKGFEANDPTHKASTGVFMLCRWTRHKRQAFLEILQGAKPADRMRDHCPRAAASRLHGAPARWTAAAALGDGRSDSLFFI